MMKNAGTLIVTSIVLVVAFGARGAAAQATDADHGIFVLPGRPLPAVSFDQAASDNRPHPEAASQKAAAAVKKVGSIVADLP